MLWAFDKYVTFTCKELFLLNRKYSFTELKKSTTLFRVIPPPKPTAASSQWKEKSWIHWKSRRPPSFSSFPLNFFPFFCMGAVVVVRLGGRKRRGGYGCARHRQTDSQARKTHSSSARPLIDVSPGSRERARANQCGSAGECWLLHTERREKTG